MEKRIILALMILTLTAGGAFAQIQLSAGAGGNFAVSWDSIEYSQAGFTMEGLLTTVGGGFFAFFDATYVEADVGMLFGTQSMKQTVGGSSADTEGPSVSFLTLSLYGKYPFDLGICTLFPMLGIQYDIGLSAKQEINGTTYEADSDALGDALNKFWIKLGVGADFNLSEKLYLRPVILWGINFGTKDNNDAVDAAEKGGIDVSTFYHGLDIRVALGFKF
jgi:hypothetical protein